MRKISILFFAFFLIVACNNDSKTSDKKEKSEQNEKKVNGNSKYSWTKKDQDKFIEDCSKGSEENVSKDKIKDYCSCMLTQAQNYYPNYRDMEENSVEEHETKMISECHGTYGD